MSFTVSIIGPDGYVDVGYDDPEDIAALIDAMSAGEGPFEWQVEEVR